MTPAQAATIEARERDHGACSRSAEIGPRQSRYTRTPSGDDEDHLGGLFTEGPVGYYSPEFSDLVYESPRDDVQKLIAEKSLSAYIQSLWRFIDPSDYRHNWHIDAICEHLEAVSRGEIKRLLITIPPRCMKSIAVSVAWPTWTWIQRPDIRFLFASYAQTLSTRDSTKARRLLVSPLYQLWWGNKYILTSDQNAKQRYDNDKGGYRLATSVDGALTGEGGDIIVVDDPHNVREGESEAVRLSTLAWWDEAMSTRLNDPATGAFVIIQQRVHEADLAGHVLDRELQPEHNGPKWTHLNLPMRYEKDRHCSIAVTGWEDPRREEGELLWPERFPEEVVCDLEARLGAYGAAGQLQQRPAPREGGMFKPDMMTIVDTIPSPPKVTLRYWDKAGTEAIKNPDAAFTAGVKMAQLTDGRFIILNVVRGQWDSFKRETIIKETTNEDGKETFVWIEQEPGSGGKESAQSTILNLAGKIVRADRPVGDKTLRADPFSVQVNAGNVLLLRGGWNKAFIEELRSFPRGKFKDQVDAASGAFSKLVTAKRAGTF